MTSIELIDSTCYIQSIPLIYQYNYNSCFCKSSEQSEQFYLIPIKQQIRNYDVPSKGQSQLETICQDSFLRIFFIIYLMINQKARQQSENSTIRRSLQSNKQAIGNLKSILQGIIKRNQSQTIYQIITANLKNIILSHKLKCFYQMWQKFPNKKKQCAFNQLKSKMRNQVAATKSTKVLKIVLERLVKQRKLIGIDKLKEFRMIQRPPARRSNLSGQSRRSESSNLLSVSQDSIRSSRVVEVEEGEIAKLGRENEQLKRMELSEEARECLMKMQRFDRYIFGAESERVLKEPIGGEMRRLQKMKNESKDMRRKYYDNQLTVTCLYNHIRLFSEMGKEQSELNALKLKISVLEKKLYDVNTEHRKEIGEYKKKLLFAEGGKGRGSRESSVDRNLGDSNLSLEDSRRTELNSEELTTFNMIVAGVRSRNLSDVGREVGHFLKISNNDKLVVVFKELLLLMGDIERAYEEQRAIANARQQLLANIAQFDKLLRSEKSEELQKFKNRSKMQSPNEFCQLLDSILSLSLEVKTLRKKESSSIEKGVKATEREKQVRSLQNQNDELKSVLKKLQARIRDIENERGREANADRFGGKSLGRQQGGEARQVEELRAEVESLRKELKQQEESSRKAEEKMILQILRLKEEKADNQEMLANIKQENTVIKSKMSRLEQSPRSPPKEREVKEARWGGESSLTPILELEESKSSSNNECLQKLKELEVFMIYYQSILERKNKQRPYQKEMRQLRNEYPDSILVQMLDTYLLLDKEHRAIANSLETLAAYSEGNCISLPSFPQEGPFLHINQISNLLLTAFQSKLQLINQVATLESSLKLKQTSANEQEALISSLESSLRQKEIAISQQTAQMSTIESTLCLKQTELSEQTSLAKTLEQSLRIKEVTLHQQAEQIRSFESNLNLKDSQLTELKSQVEQLESTIQLQQVELTKQTDKVKSFESFTLLKQTQQRELLAQVKVLQQSIRLKVTELSEAKAKEHLQLSKQTQPLAQLQELRHKNSEINLRVSHLQLQLKSSFQNMQAQEAKIVSTEQENNILSAELSHAIQSNKTLIEEIRKFQIEIGFIKEESSALIRKSEQYDILEGRIGEYNEKLAEYQFYFQSIQKDRDNLRLLLDEKAEEYEEAKERAERAEGEEAQMKELLKKLQVDFRQYKQDMVSLKQEGKSLKEEKERSFNEIRELQGVMELKDEEIRSYISLIQSHEESVKYLQAELTRTKLNVSADISQFEQERNKLVTQMNHAVEESKKMRIGLQLQVSQYHQQVNQLQQQCRQYQLQCSRVQQQLTQSKFSSQQQRTILHQQLQLQFHQEKLDHQTLNNRQKDQLREQITAAKAQLASSLQYVHNQIRQHQNQIEQLTNQARSNTIKNNQQVRILRQAVERARSEEYQINQAKIRQLRQDIQALRGENERLTTIIDQNQVPFNKLVEEHRGMCIQMTSLQSENSRLLMQSNLLKEENQGLQNSVENLNQQVNWLQDQKKDLLQHLEGLENKLASLERRVVMAVQQEKIKEATYNKNSSIKIGELESEITLLHRENASIISVKEDQDGKMRELIMKMGTLQAHLEGFKQVGRKEEQIQQSSIDQYRKYLEEQLKDKEVQNRRLRQNEQELARRVQHLLEKNNQIQTNNHSIISQLNAEANFKYCKYETDLAFLTKQLIEARTSAEYHQALPTERTPNLPMIDEAIIALQQQVQMLRSEIQRKQVENSQLRMISNQNCHHIRLLESKAIDSQNFLLQNKMLSNRISLLMAEVEEMQRRYRDAENQIASLRSKAGNEIVNQAIPSNQSNLKEQVRWCKQQLKSKEQQISKLRNSLLSFQIQSNKYKETIISFQNIQQKYIQTTQLLSYLQLQQREMDSLNKNLNFSIRQLNQNHQNQIRQKDHLVETLQISIKQLICLKGSLQGRLNAIESRQSLSNQQGKTLLDVVRLLGGNHHGEEMEAMILQRISCQISQLIDSNDQLKEKCALLQDERLKFREMEEEMAAGIRGMFSDILSYFKSNQLINPEQTPSFPEDLPLQKTIGKLGAIIATLFSDSYKRSEDQVIKYNGIIRDIRAVLQEVYQNDDYQSLRRLRLLLIQAD